MLNYRKKLGLLALLFGIAVLSGCGGGSGTDNKQTNFPSCRDPEVLLDNGQCGLPRDPYVPPACPEGEIRGSDGECVEPDFPAPEKLPGENEVVIYVNVDSADKNADFASYNLHLWQDCGNGWASSVTDGTNTTYAIPTTWPNGPHISSHDTGAAGVRHDPYYGAFFVIPTSELGTCGNFIIKTPNGAAQTNDLSINIKHDGGDYERMMWVIVNTQNMRNSRVSNIPICINDNCTLEQPMVAISGVEAHWISSHTIVWDREFAAGKKVELYHSTAGGMTGADNLPQILNGDLLAELSEGRPLTEDEQAKAPQLANYIAYDLPDTVSVEAIKAALKDELLIVGYYDSEPEGDATPVERARATRVQVAEVLDQLYTSGDNDADEAQLGVSYNDGITASVWAPTAQKVELRIFSGDPLRVSATKDMTFDSNTGIWSFTGTADEMDRKYYRFRVTAYNPLEKKILRLEVTDPYSISLATNGSYSQFVNLDDADTKPAGWDAQVVPDAGAPEAASIYETHVRDFSVNDTSTNPEYRGKYMAFTQTDSVPMQHLEALANAGLTYIHLLPVADGSSIKEDFASQVNLDSYVYDLCQKLDDPSSVSVCDGSVSYATTFRSLLESYDPQSSEARDLIAAIAGYDGFNWNYDPEHYDTPDGAYATDAQGETRIKEMRAMNLSLHSIGLRVVMDVVYPHTSASGVKYANSVFDKIVPGYYYRTNAATDEVENGTFAGADTATEHRMMAKFMKDSLVMWATEYKVDGFRFDQSGYMSKAALVEAYDAVKSVDPDNYFYAEAWTPAGGTSGDRIAERATQEELAGTGIGTFNDRIRNPLQQMALIKGDNVDAVRAGIAGNLKDFQLKTKSGVIVKAETVGAYNLDPQESINYVEKHDNETLWDWMHRPNALPVDMSLADRVRVDSLTQSVVLLSQGVPFFQMGTELLRSKSMCPNSYNAGDWFNAVDFTMASNNWGVGLPPELRDGVTDEYVAGLFANPNTKPDMAEIEKSNAVFQEYLKIASGSPLFSLTTAQEVMDRLGFHDGGKTQVPGLIVFSLDDGVGTVAGTDSTARADLDPSVDAIVVVINGTATTQNAKVNTATGFALHSIQQNSADPVVKTASFAEADGGGVFSVPAYTTAVFVKAQAGAQGAGLSATATIGSAIPVPYGDTAVYLRGDITAAGWDATSANQMHYDGDGIYSLLAEALSGPRIFKVAEANWNTPNLGGAIAFNIGDSATLAQGSNDNLSMSLAANKTLRFVLDAASSTTAPTLSVIDPDTFGATAVYLRGEVTASGWGADAGNQVVYEGDSIYALSVAMTPGTYQFKVASSDWSTFNLGAAADVTLGQDVTLTQGSNDNLHITIATAGTYRFEVDTRNAAAPKLRVYVDDIFAATPVYVRGDITASGWNADAGNLMTYAGAGRYTLTTNIAAGSYVFKLAETNWSNPNLGAQSASVGEPTLLTQGSNDNIAITIPSTGDYTFTLDTRVQDAMTVTVMGN